jgi:hypothetical protein
MLKKLYRKDGFIYIDDSKEHNVGSIEKNYFIITKFSEKNGEIKKDDLVKEYYKSKGFHYTL